MKDARLTALFILIALLAGYPIRLDAQFVYTFGQINKANKILGYSITANGSLVPVPGSPFTAGTEPSTIAADPKGKYVYVVNSPTLVDGANISAFRVSSTGDLSPVPGSPFGLGYYGSVLVDPNGKFLFVIDISTTQDPEQPPSPNYISVFRIGPSGSLEEVPGSPFVAGDNANPLVVDQTGQYLYVGVQDEVPFWAPEPPFIAGYKIESNGALTQLSSSPFQTNPANAVPVALVPDPRGKYFYEFGYSANTNTGTVAVYQIGANGVINLVPDSTMVLSALGTIFSFSATADPRAGFVYATVVNSNTYSTGAIVSSKIGANGNLTPIILPPLSSGSPYGLGTDPSGKFLYATQFAVTGLWEYQIAGDGSLTPVPGSPIVTNLPWGQIAIVP